MTSTAAADEHSAAESVEPLDVGPRLKDSDRDILLLARDIDRANGRAVDGGGLLTGIRSGVWLDAQVFPPLRYVVPGLVPEGLTLVVGAPKIGKSWYTLDACLAAAAGGFALGCIATGPARPVLYLALEDSDRRMQDRCRQLLVDGEPIPGRFEYLTRVASPGEVTLTVAAWLGQHPGEQPFVVIDTLGKAMPLTLQGETVYQRDYRVMGELKQLCDAEPGAGIVVNHHDRKASADDFVDFVSGTNGLAGGADTIMVLSRDRGENAGLLRVTGRDVPEGAYALTLVPGTWWRLDGATLEAAADAARSAKTSAGLGDKSAAIVAYVGQHPRGVRADDVASELDIPSNAARVYLARLHESGRIERRHRGVYTPIATVASVTSERNEHNACNTPTARELDL